MQRSEGIAWGKDGHFCVGGVGGEEEGRLVDDRGRWWEKVTEHAGTQEAQDSGKREGSVGGIGEIRADE